MADTLKLTKSRIDAIEPASKDAIHWDGDLKGFGIKVTPTGRKVFVVMHRPKGHRGAARKYTIGKFGEWTVQQARERAREIRVESSKGFDIGAKERSEAQRRSADKVNDLVDDFLQKHAAQNRTARETERILNREVLPKIGKRSIHDVTKHDVITVIEDVAKRGSPIMANRTLAVVRKFLNWCVSRGVIETSPAQGVQAFAKERSRDRVLSDDETRAIIKAARSMGYPFGPIIELLFLTAQRRDEVGQMRWSEINIDNALWTIPSERMKNGKAHDVHLSSQALIILKSLPRFVLPDGSECDLVFTTNGKTPVSGFSKAKAYLDTQSEVTAWRLHDIRRTVVTGMSKMGVPVHVADTILNHKSGMISGITAVYQRNQFNEERTKALTEWSERLERMSETASAYA